MTTRVINVGDRDRAELLSDPDFVYVGRRTRGQSSAPVRASARDSRTRAPAFS